MIKGSEHLPPAPYLVGKQMEDLLFWYSSHKSQLHPVVLAAEMHERLVTIHPFIDGNGRTSRLIMNLILLNGYTIANIKGDSESRMSHYVSLKRLKQKATKRTS
jgi:Fic family protein